MKIERTMDLDALAERMGRDATREEAGVMADFLLVGDYTDTEDIPEAEWLELLEHVAAGLARNAELDAARKGEWP